MPCAPVAPRSATARAGPATHACGQLENRAGILPGQPITTARGPAASGRRGAPGVFVFAAASESAALDRASCEPCLEKRREADRAKYAAGKAVGLLYGGADPDARKKYARARSKRRQKARVEAGLCIRCGDRPPVEGGTTCAPCREKRQAAERRQYAERRAAGHCVRCGGPVFDGLSRCAPCAVAEEVSRNPERKNARSRKLYARTARARLMYILRSAGPGGFKMRPVRREILSRLGVFPGDPGLGPELDGDRAGDGPGSTGHSTAKPTWRSASPSKSSAAREVEIVL